MSSTKTSLVCSKLVLRSGDLSRWTLWWVTADQWLKATSTPSSKSLIYKRKTKTSYSQIMWHRYAKCTIGWLFHSSSRCKEVRGQLHRDRGRTLSTMCMCEEIERGTDACKQESWGPSNDDALRMVNWESQSKTHPPESRRRTHLLYFTYSYCILPRVYKLATSLLVLRYRGYEHLFLISLLKLQLTS